MKWNWQQENWPEFSYDPEAIQEYGSQFLHRAGVILHYAPLSMCGLLENAKGVGKSLSLIGTKVSVSVSVSVILCGWRDSPRPARDRLLVPPSLFHLNKKGN